MRYSRPRLAILAGLFLALLALGNGTVAGHPASTADSLAGPAAKLYGTLGAKAAHSSADTHFRVIVHLKAQVNLNNWPTTDRAGALLALHHVADTTQPAVRTFLAQASPDVNVYQTYWIFNGFALDAPLATIQALAARDDVDYIIEDGVLSAPAEPLMTGYGVPDNAASNWNIYQVNAPQTWALGYDGTGRTAANLDTGVDGAHQALAPRWRGILPGHTPADSWLDPFGLSPTFPTASGSHGTHTMGTIAGYFGDSTGINEIGQAKGAAWIACRIYDTTGKGPFSYMHACFQFMADPDGNPLTNDQPDAVGNSWGDTASDSFPDLEWYPDVLAWRAVGVIPVFSSANSGPAPGTVNEPGSYPQSVAVGAVDINRTIAGFSSRGPAENLPPWNDPNNWERSDWNLVKPEVVAPGVNVRSSLPGNTYGNLSGTSMASPHVTGLASLLRQIRPDLTVNEFYNIIIDTAYFSPTWGVRPNNNYGWGEIDDYAAAIYVRDAGAVSGTIMDASCATAVSGVNVRVTDNTPGSRAQGVGIRKLASDSTGHYRTILAAGTYTVSVTAPGYYGMNFSTTVMSSTTSTLPISLVKMATGVVSGVVNDGTNPVAGATVSVDGLPNMTTTTNAQGQYTLNAVPAGTFTLRAEKCSYTGAHTNITVVYPNPLTQNFTLGSPTPLLVDDFESGTLNNWTVTGGTTTTAIWNPSTVRAMSGTYAARAGIPGQPMYTGAASTYMTSASSYDASTADRVWLSFNLYDSAESEYDILRAQVSSDGGTTWATVYGEASPVHGWQAICLDVTNWRSATMKIRFYFTSDGSNWNNQVFEGPSVDDVRFTASMAAATATATSIPARTPTPGAQLPCGQGTSTPTVTVTLPPGTATATATVCPIQFADVLPADPFYTYIRCLVCRNILSGYTTSPPCASGQTPCYNGGANVTRGQVAKIVANAANYSEVIPSTQQTFMDVPASNPFWVYVERAAMHNVISGYSASPPCPAGQVPCFLPFNNVTRGQMSKIDAQAANYSETIPSTQQTFTDVPNSNPFWVYVERAAMHGVISGYSTSPPCPGGTPCFLWANNLTRNQGAKIVAVTFYPNCQTPVRR